MTRPVSRLASSTVTDMWKHHLHDVFLSPLASRSLQPRSVQYAARLICRKQSWHLQAVPCTVALSIPAYHNVRPS